MGWNEPQKNKDNDPRRDNQGPPDLDEMLRRFHNKFKHIFMGDKAPPADSSGSNGTSAGLMALLFMLVLSLLWALSGIFIVGPAEQAAILRFGRYIETVGAGPHWIPRFIESKYVVNTDQVLDYSYSANMLTKHESLVSVAVAVKYRIGDLSDYLFNVADPEESLKQATSSALRQVVGNTSLDELITEGREAWGADVQETLTRTLAIYKTGIVVVNVSPQSARAPENVQDAFDDAIKAQEDERRFTEQARAYEAKVVPIALGRAKRIVEEAKAQAKQTVLRAQGETAEYLALLPQYQATPFVTSERMYLDTLTRVFSKTTKVLVDNKAGNILYLPIDKLQAATAPAVSEPKNTTSGDTNSTNLSLYDGRELVRPTERLGRDA